MQAHVAPAVAAAVAADGDSGPPAGAVAAVAHLLVEGLPSSSSIPTP